MQTNLFWLYFYTCTNLLECFLKTVDVMYESKFINFGYSILIIIRIMNLRMKLIGFRCLALVTIIFHRVCSTAIFLRSWQSENLRQTFGRNSVHKSIEFFELWWIFEFSQIQVVLICHMIKWIYIFCKSVDERNLKEKTFFNISNRINTRHRWQNIIPFSLIQG